MTDSALPFPNSQTLAAWSRQLLARRPFAIWVGDVRIHRVEFLAEIAHTRRLDPVTRAVLAVLELGTLAPTHARTSLADLELFLGLDRSLLRPKLNQLVQEGLIAAEIAESGMPSSWAATAAAVRARQQGQVSANVTERRVLSFMENDSSPRRVLFTNLMEDSARLLLPAPPSLGEPCPFELSSLESCIGQSSAWKKRRGFPAEVQRIVSNLDDHPSPAAEKEHWQRVAVDRVERLFVVMLREAGGLHAFAVRRQGWVLQAARPCFSLDDGDWEEFFTELATGTSLDSWRLAWLNWGRSRNWPVGELDECSLECDGICVRAVVGRELMDRVRSARGDPLKGENWLVTGTGSLRACAKLEIVPA
jgi:hypothetical protein